MLPRVAKSEIRFLSMLHCKIDLARLKTALPVAIKASEQRHRQSAKSKGKNGEWRWRMLEHAAT